MQERGRLKVKDWGFEEALGWNLRGRPIVERPIGASTQRKTLTGR